MPIYFIMNYQRFPFILFSIISICSIGYSQTAEFTQPRYKVTLSEAHIGNLDIDLKLLDSYEPVEDHIRQFYKDARAVFTEKKDADFMTPGILEAAQQHNIPLMGGPMLGNLKDDGVSLWLRPASSKTLNVIVTRMDGNDKKTFSVGSAEPGRDQRIILDGLSPDTKYKYEVYSMKNRIAEGSLKTAPSSEEKSIVRIAFGSCFHKIGLHNPNLINQILRREPHAMMLLGDIAVDDRENNFNMHHSDYLLREMSKPWQRLSANVPLYTSWDDHDYLNNDLNGIPEGFHKADQEGLRTIWQQNWNNPENESEGIFFNTRIGAVELIMLDTRSCREVNKRGKYGSYLGTIQQKWLKETLKKSTAPFKIISSGTMWSDYISNGKDSWGTWDTLARDEIFDLIETENITGVLLVSGDRHGARGFRIPRPSGFFLYEFEAASLGGVPGPDAMATNAVNQIFGYHGTETIAFGEFTFNTIGDKPLVTFRLIDQSGHILEEQELSYSRLTPRNE
jgi:alkaline phosphatase D